jgi:hypothetical protein
LTNGKAFPIFSTPAAKTIDTGSYESDKRDNFLLKGNHIYFPVDRENYAIAEKAVVSAQAMEKSRPINPEEPAVVL